jgi:hypothetical protein
MFQVVFGSVYVFIAHWFIETLALALTWQKLHSCTFTGFSVYTKQIALEVYEITLDLAHVVPTNPTQLGSTLVTVFITHRFQQITEMTDVLIEFLCVCAMVYTKSVPTHSIDLFCI